LTKFFICLSIWDDFKKSTPIRSVLATIDVSKAFDSVWHSALFYKVIALYRSRDLLFLLDLGLPVKQSSKGLFPWRSKPFGPHPTWIPPTFCPWPSPLHSIYRRPY